MVTVFSVQDVAARKPMTSQFSQWWRHLLLCPRPGEKNRCRWLRSRFRWGSRGMLDIHSPEVVIRSHTGWGLTSSMMCSGSWRQGSAGPRKNWRLLSTSESVTSKHARSWCKRDSNKICSHEHGTLMFLFVPPMGPMLHNLHGNAKMSQFNSSNLFTNKSGVSLRFVGSIQCSSCFCLWQTYLINFTIFLWGDPTGLTETTSRFLFQESAIHFV